MKKFRIYSLKFIYILLSLILLSIIINALLFASYLRKDYIFPISNFLLIILSGLVIWGIIFIIFRVAKKHNDIFNTIVVLIGVVFQLWIALGIQGATGIDDFDIRVQVAKYVNGGTQLSNYFIYGANNIPITLIYTGVGKIIRTLGADNYLTLIFNLFQCIILDITIGIVFFFIKKKINKIVASLFLFLAVFFVPLCVYTTFLYTDIISSCLAIIGAISFVKFNDNNHYLYLFISGLLESLAYSIKMNVVIMTISIVIIIMLRNTSLKGFIKVLSIFIISFLFISLSTNLVVKNISNFSDRQINRNSFPYSFWMNVGLDRKTNGQFDGELWNEGSRFQTLVKRKKFYTQKLQMRFKHGELEKIPNLYLKKINIMYSEGDLGSASRALGISKNVGGVYQYIGGKKNNFYIIYSQMMYVVLLSFCLVYSISRIYKRDQDEMYLDIVGLFFIGIFLFHILMWEVMPRYALVSVNAILPVAAMGIYTICSSEYYDKNSWKMGKVSFISLLLLFSVGFLKYKGNLIREGSETDRVVLSQVAPFHMYKPLIIPSHSSIKEKIYVPHNFKKVNVIYWAPNVDIAAQSNLKLIIYNQNAQVVNNIDEKKSGSYTLEIKNTTSGPTAIAITNSNNMDILQKPIINTKNKYLNFNVID